MSFRAPKALSDQKASKADTFFPPTSLSLLTRATQASTVTAGMNEFAELYEPAIRAFISSIVRDPVAAADLTQHFFLEVVIERQLLDAAESRKGTFRQYLKRAVRNFLVDDYRYRSRKKRRASQPDERPDGREDGWDRVLTAGSAGHDRAFLKGWAEGVVRTALRQVARACKRRGQEEHFRLFSARYLAPSDPMPSWRELGEPFGLHEKIARSRAETVARHVRTAIRQLVGGNGWSAARVDEEIRELIDLF